MLSTNVLKMVKRRYVSHVKRSKELGIDPPIFNDFIRLFEETDYMCPYCKKRMLLDDPYPYRYRPSVDHKNPLSCGGSNDYENLLLCCTSCNIIKGTLDDKYFYRLLKVLEQDEELRDVLFAKWFNYGLANKIERNELENDQRNQ